MYIFKVKISLSPFTNQCTAKTTVSIHLKFWENVHFFMDMFTKRGYLKNRILKVKNLKTKLNSLN